MLKLLDKKDLYTPQEVAEYFIVDIKTIYRWCKCGKLKYIQKGNGGIRIPRESIIEFKNNG